MVGNARCGPDGRAPPERRPARLGWCNTMNGPDASSSEMPGLPFYRWRGTEPDVPLLDMIMAGQPLPPDAPRQIRVLAHRLTELARPAGPGELPGEAVAMSAFRHAVSPASTMPLALPRRNRRREPRLMAGRARLAAVFATAAVAVGGTAAAYAGVLPASVQEFAHRLIDAPPASHRAAHSPSGNQSPGGRHGGASSRSEANRKHQLAQGTANGHGKRKPHPVGQGKASRHRPRKPAHRARRHRPKVRPTPTPTPTPSLTPIR